MAKSIAVRFADEPSSFAFAKLDRAKLYGHKERQVVDAEGRRCTSAWLSSDGAALVPSGGLAMLYVDPGFSTIERSALKTTDAEGKDLALLPSTLGVEQPLDGPVPAARLLDHDIATVYQLAPEQIGPRLAAELSEGRIFSAPFSYRDDYQRQTLFLLQNDTGIFALIGEPSGFTFIGREVAPPVAGDDGDDLADDLDFSML